MHWIIGDIHGMLKPLEALLKSIAREDSAASLLFAGDYINRGPDSRGVVDLLLTLPQARFIRGNHDDVFDQILPGDAADETAEKFPAAERLAALHAFLPHGLDRTLASYGATPADLSRAQRGLDVWGLDALLAPVPPAHRAFFRNLPLVIEEPDFFVAHGRWDPRDKTTAPPLALRLQQHNVRQTMLWGRFNIAEIDTPKEWSKTGYFGHTPVDNYPIFITPGNIHPIRGEKMVLLDTASALRADGMLTAWCHQRTAFLQADRAGIVTMHENRLMR